MSKNKSRDRNKFIPQTNKTTLQQNPRSIIIGQQYTGPIPPPEALEKYEKVLPGLADRIVKQAEAQTGHRIKQEDKVISSDILNSKLGLIFGFIIGMVGVVGGFVMVYLGKDVGWLFSGGALVGLVGTFVYGRRTRERERKQIREEEQR